MALNGITTKKIRITRTEAVRRQLEIEILDGILTPGTHLDEKVQSARLGCSRTPLREAINQLVAVGLLTRRPHCGVSVSGPGGGRALEMLDAFAELEALCAAQAAAGMSAIERARLGRLADDADRLRKAIRLGCGNRWLADMASGLDERVGRLRRMEGDLAIERDRAAARELARAVAAGDGATAGRVIRDRVRCLGETARHTMAARSASSAAG